MHYKIPWTDRLKYPLITAAIAVAGSVAWSAAQAAQIPLGYISWDVTTPGEFGQFDIVNLTGSNSLPPSFPVSTTVQLSSLSLTVDFSDGSVSHFGPSYFTLASDGQSWDGTSIGIGGVSPQPTEAILTGDLSPTTIDVSGTPTTVDSSFDTATVLPSTPPDLADGDNAIINADTGVAPPPVPEPNMTLTFLIGGFMVLIFARRRDGLKRLLSAARFGGGGRGGRCDRCDPVSGGLLRRDPFPDHRVEPRVGCGGCDVPQHHGVRLSVWNDQPCECDDQAGTDLPGGRDGSCRRRGGCDGDQRQKDSRQHGAGQL